jgi:release factor glutamine methyltransferase
VLIPRIETEELVELALAELADKPLTQPLVMADVGTGSGAIGLTLLLELEKKGHTVELYASDVSSTAVEVARENWRQLGAKSSSQAQLLTSDLLAIYPAGIKFDLMVANLPYIPSARIDYLDASVKDYEPVVALDGGPEGLSLIHQFLLQAKPKLKPKAAILLEMDHTHSLTEMLPAGLEATTRLFQDSFGQNRFTRVAFD